MHHFGWRVKRQSFARAIIQFRRNCPQIDKHDRAQIRSLRNMSADQADRVFDRALLPPAIRMTEECATTQGPRDVLMIPILGSVVEGQRVDRQGDMLEHVNQTLGALFGGPVRQFVHHHITGTGIYRNRDRCEVPLDTLQQIRFPMSLLAPLTRHGRTPFDRNPIRNRRVFRSVGRAPVPRLSARATPPQELS